jgi:peptide/nickel transport system substrate-binding protein
MRHALLTLLALLVIAVPAAAGPEGQMTWAVHITLAPTWFDPAETPGIGTPLMILYALHDALVKPMPGNAMAPGLAESWSVSKDGLVYEFVLRHGLRFHNGDALTAEDVKFSFERYRGAASRFMKEKVPVVEVVDPVRVRFRLKEPWPDFMTYYGSLTTGAGWIVPKKYLEKVGDDGFKKVPDEATRLAMLKRGEADIVYLLQSELAQEVQRTPGLTLRPTPIVSTHWLVFLDQWDPKSPWADRRVRLAANHAIDRQALNESITLGFSRITWSIIPQSFDFFWQPPLRVRSGPGEEAARRGRAPERLRCR